MVMSVVEKNETEGLGKVRFGDLNRIVREGLPGKVISRAPGGWRELCRCLGRITPTGRTYKVTGAGAHWGCSLTAGRQSYGS